jgi:hypothetical protein
MGTVALSTVGSSTDGSVASGSCGTGTVGRSRIDPGSTPGGGGTSTGSGGVRVAGVVVPSRSPTLGRAFWSGGGVIVAVGTVAAGTVAVPVLTRSCPSALDAPP